MELRDAFWHLVNFILLPVMLGGLAAAAVKGLWRRELAALAWARLALWASAAAMLAQLAGLLATGRDGRMVTYLGMVAASALTLWWRGFLLGSFRKRAR